MGIADRFLADLSQRGENAPKLSHLTVISLIMAAKLNETKAPPSFNTIVGLLNHWDAKCVHKRELLKMEENVLRTL